MRFGLRLAGALVLFTGFARAEPPELDEREILEPPGLGLELVQTRVSAYWQRGNGYQSQAGPREGPGSEWLSVLQTQAELSARQDGVITHRLWIPVDIVTSASTDASDRYYAEPDVVSRASVTNISEEGTYEMTIRANPDTEVRAGATAHNEENFRSWTLALSYNRSLADKNAVLGISANQVLDWFDVYELGGQRIGRTSRSSSNANVSISQLLSPLTSIAAGYGLTLQRGQLSNTWNSVPSTDGERVQELLPKHRDRHAAFAELLQWLPVEAALRLRYRLYLDDWDVTAHSVEVDLSQRPLPFLELHGGYRYHSQSSVSYYTTRTDPDARYRTADSDLASLHAQTLEAGATFRFPFRAADWAFIDFSYAHYFRSNDLEVEVATCASGLRF